MNKRVRTCEGVRVFACERTPQAGGGREGVKESKERASRLGTGSVVGMEGSAQTPRLGDRTACQGT